MSSVRKTAGVPGIGFYTLQGLGGVGPFSAPRMTIYSDAARLVVAQAEQELTATANPDVWQYGYSAALAPGTYYLRTLTVITDGQPPLDDADDTLELVLVLGSVGDLARLRDLAGEPDDSRGWTDVILNDVQARWLCAHTDEATLVTTYTNDVYAAAAEIWETKALRTYGTSPGIASERNLDVSVTYRDGPSAEQMLKVSKRMLRRSCAWAGGTRTVSVLSPDDKTRLDELDYRDVPALLGTWPDPRLNAPEPRN